ncbi:hypothetical protein PENTCL1PPCAC_30696, partial [Pristionchus entomophagus]
ISRHYLYSTHLSSNKTRNKRRREGYKMNDIPTDAPFSLHSSTNLYLPRSLRLSHIENGCSLLESGRDVSILGGIGQSLINKSWFHVMTTDQNFLLGHCLDSTEMSPVLSLVLPVVVHGLEDSECHDSFWKSHSHCSTVVRSSSGSEEMLVQPIERKSVGDSNGIELTMDGIHHNGLIGVQMLVRQPFTTPFTLSRRQTRSTNTLVGHMQFEAHWVIDTMRGLVRARLFGQRRRCQSTASVWRMPNFLRGAVLVTHTWKR